MKDAIEKAIHALRDALSVATTNPDQARKSVKEAIDMLSPFVAGKPVGPDPNAGLKGGG